VRSAEIRELPTEEILRALEEQRRALFNLRFQRETEQLERSAETGKIRREVARLLTILRERELAEVADSSRPAAS